MAPPRQSTRCLRDRRTGRRSAAVVLAAAAVFVAASFDAAADDSSHQLTSAADGVRVSIDAGNAPVTNVLFDLGAPVAQTSLDSIGTRQSFASLPYPGDLVVTAPGTVAGFSGGQVTPPSYPFVVQASHPLTPEAELDRPGYRLRATAGPGDATSSASSGLHSDSGAAAASVATSEVRRTDDGSLRAASASEVTGFSTGPLTIGAVRSTAELTAPVSGSATKRSHLRVSGMEVGDVAVELTPAGLRLAGANAPLPPTSPVAQLLATNGIELDYLSSQESDELVVSSAVAVTVTRTVDGPITPIRVTYILGRSGARITTASGSTAPPARSAGAVAGGGTGPASTPSRAGGSSLGVDSPVGIARLTADGGGTLRPSSRSFAAQRVGLAPPEFGTSGAYSLLVVGGLVVLALTLLNRRVTNRRAEVSS